MISNCSLREAVVFCWYKKFISWFHDDYVVQLMNKYMPKGLLFEVPNTEENNSRRLIVNNCIGLLDEWR